jgi:hypothetical protein
MAIYVLLKTKQPTWCGNLRNSAKRAKVGNVIAIDSRTTMVQMGSSHSGRWLDKWAKDHRHSILDRNVKSVPETPFESSCGIYFTSIPNGQRHVARCKRCHKPEAVTIQAQTAIEVTQDAAVGNEQNRYVPTKVVRPPEAYTVDATPEEIDAVIDKSESTPAERQVERIVGPDPEVVLAEIYEQAMAMAAKADEALGTLKELAALQASLDQMNRSFAAAKAKIADRFGD